MIRFHMIRVHITILAEVMNLLADKTFNKCVSSLLVCFCECSLPCRSFQEVAFIAIINLMSVVFKFSFIIYFHMTNVVEFSKLIGQKACVVLYNSKGQTKVLALT